MKKTIIAAATALVLAMGLSACNGYFNQGGNPNYRRTPDPDYAANAKHHSAAKAHKQKLVAKKHKADHEANT